MDSFIYKDIIKISEVKQGNSAYPLNKVEKIDNQPVQEFFEKADTQKILNAYFGKYSVQIKK